MAVRSHCIAFDGLVRISGCQGAADPRIASGDASGVNGNLALTLADV
jgi:hypothetical protein